MLSGVPPSPSLATALDALGYTPHLVFVPSTERESVGEALRAPTPVAALCEHYAPRRLVRLLDGNKSAWAMRAGAEAEARAHLCLRQRRAAAAASRGAAAVGALGVTLAEFDEGAKTFGRYCPVTWQVERRLWLCGRDGVVPVIEHAAWYDGEYVACASATKLAAFLLHPAAAIGAAPLPTPLPAKLPDVTTAEDRGYTRFELDSYCPVSLRNGPKGASFDARSRALRRGDRARHAVEYTGGAGKYFCLADADAEAEFLSRPWRYARLTLPAKRPPDAVETNADRLPVRYAPLARLPQPPCERARSTRACSRRPHARAGYRTPGAEPLIYWRAPRPGAGIRRAGPRCPTEGGAHGPRARTAEASVALVPRHCRPVRRCTPQGAQPECARAAPACAPWRAPSRL